MIATVICSVYISRLPSMHVVDTHLSIKNKKNHIQRTNMLDTVKMFDTEGIKVQFIVQYLTL